MSEEMKAARIDSYEETPSSGGAAQDLAHAHVSPAVHRYKANAGVVNRDPFVSLYRAVILSTIEDLKIKVHHA